MKYLLWLCIVLTVSCRSATSLTSSSESSMKYATSYVWLRDTIVVQDTTRVRLVRTDSVNYIYNDRIRNIVRTLYRDKTDTLLVRDTVVTTVVKTTPTKARKINLLFFIILSLMLLLILTIYAVKRKE